MKSKTKSAVAAPVERTDDYVADLMADQMLRYGEGCTRSNLEMHFTPDEVERLHGKARALANERASGIRTAA